MLVCVAMWAIAAKNHQESSSLSSQKLPPIP